MANQKVWLQNTAQFPFVDPESGTRFEPGTPIKAELTAFVSQQPTIVRVTDPNDDEPSEKEVARIAALNAADAEALAKREAAAEAVMAQTDVIAAVEAHPNAPQAEAAPAAKEKA